MEGKILNVEITEQTLKDLDYIKNNIIKKFKNEIVDVSALIVAFEAIVQMQDKLKKEMGE